MSLCVRKGVRVHILKTSGVLLEARLKILEMKRLGIEKLLRNRILGLSNLFMEGQKTNKSTRSTIVQTT